MLLDQYQPGCAPWRNLPTPRLLLIEDDLRTRRTFRTLLRGAGCDVVSTSTIAGGLWCLDQCHEFDFIILDLSLPDGDGETILRSIRDRHLDVRVVVTTGETDFDRLQEVEALGPALLLPKPVDIDRLLGWIGDRHRLALPVGDTTE